MTILDRISDNLNQWVEYLLCGLGITMALVVAAQVFFRYVLNQSLFWSEELARYLLVWITFLGASSAYYRKANPGVDVLYNRMPAKYRRMMVFLVHFSSMALFIVMIFYGVKFAYFVRLQISPALQLPRWIIISIIPVSGAILLIHGITFSVQVFKRGSNDH